MDPWKCYSFAITCWCGLALRTFLHSFLRLYLTLYICVHLMLRLTYNLEITVGSVTVHNSLSRAGVATFVPNLSVQYSQVANTIFVLNDRKPKGEKDNEKSGWSIQRIFSLHLRRRFNINMAVINHQPYHDTFILLPLCIKVDDSEVYSPDKCDVQHGVVWSLTLQNHLVTNSNLSVLRCYCDAGSL